MGGIESISSRVQAIPDFYFGIQASQTVPYEILAVVINLLVLLEEMFESVREKAVSFVDAHCEMIFKIQLEILQTDTAVKQ